MSRERYVCVNWDKKRETCMFNKKLAMEFLNSVGAVVKDGPKRASVDPQTEWSSEDYDRYHKMMSELASGVGGLNLPTGIISCGEYEDGKNIDCNQYSCPGKKGVEEAKKNNPDSLVVVTKHQ